MLSEEDGSDLNKGRELTGPMTVLGLLNGMIGISSLSLPIIGITTGYLTTVWVCLLIGFICYYTAHLIVLHLGQAKNIKQCVLQHFSHKYSFMTAYSFVMWVSFIPTIIGYFRIICLQIVSILGHQSPWVAPGVAIFLFFLVLLVRNLHFWQDILAYGLISIIALLVFLVWALVTAPQGPRQVPPTGEPFILASVMVGAYQIHDFMIQNLAKNPNKSQYPSLVRWTFIIGSLVFIYFSLGSFALINRQPIVKNSQIITDFFRSGQWQVIMINAIFIIHTASAFPTYLIVSKIRFYQMFKIDIERSVRLKDVVYVLVAVLMAYLVYVVGVNLISVYAFNGAVIGYIYVFLIPIAIHIKCVWVDRSSGFIEGDQEWNNRIQVNSCRCEARYSSKMWLYLQTFLLMAILIVGMVMIFFTVKKLFAP